MTERQAAGPDGAGDERGEGEGESGAGHRLPGRAGTWRDELDDFARAVSGAFVFAIPLLYTMETWWIGESAELPKLLLFLAGGFLVAFGLARTTTGGFKAETSLGASLEQAVDVVAVGLVGGVVVLLVLNQIGPGDPPAAVLGKVVLQAVPLAIGASVANAIFGPRGDKNRQGDDGDGEPAGTGSGSKPGDARHELLADLGATVVGAIFVGLAIAPTAEIPMLAAEMELGHELALVGLSLLLSYAVVFASGFGTGQGEQSGPFQHPLTETAFAYVVSLLVALACLALFDQIEAGDAPAEVLSMVLVLGLPTAIGGAAGRLVV